MDNLKKLLLSCYVFLCTGALLIWMHQDSLEMYWQQSYHQPPPWQTLKTESIWQAGTRVHTATAMAWQIFRLEISGQTLHTAAVLSELASQAAAAGSLAISQQVIPPAVVERLDISEQIIHIAAAAALGITEQATSDCMCSVIAAPVEGSQVALVENQSLEVIAPAVKLKQYAEISAGQRVFFAGDSMMQGVAPHLAVRLRREYGLSSIDLSRQSTGLAYPKSFNWPATIAQTLADNPDIKLLAIFLGPNDPWDMPSGRGGKYLRYASADWEELYRSRIREIIGHAQEHNVDIIWVSSPYMRRKKLSTQVSYLNELYESEVLQAGEVFLSSNQVFQYPEATYSDYMGDGSVKQKMRSGDGIHFTPAGQRTLADALFELIVFTPEKQTEHDSQLAAHTPH